MDLKYLLQLVGEQTVMLAVLRSQVAELEAKLAEHTKTKEAEKDEK